MKRQCSIKFSAHAFFPKAVRQYEVIVSVGQFVHAAYMQKNVQTEQKALRTIYWRIFPLEFR